MFTDPSGEIFGIDDIIIAALIAGGAYLGGVGMNEGEMNPLSWDWQSPDTYFGIGFGALLGYVGGYGLVNPGTVNFALGIGSPAAGLYLTGNASDWNFEWSTAAGGGGNLDLSQPVTFTDIVNGSNERINAPKIQNNFNSQELDDAIQRWSNYSSGVIYADLPEVSVYWNSGEESSKYHVPYWWGYTNLMANPYTQSRVMNEGIDLMYFTLAIPTSTIILAEAFGYLSYQGYQVALYKYPRFFLTEKSPSGN